MDIELIHNKTFVERIKVDYDSIDFFVLTDALNTTLVANYIEKV